MAIESYCKNCFSVNTDRDALIFSGVLIEGQRYDVRIICRDAAGNAIVIPENAKYLKTMVEQVVDLSAKIFQWMPPQCGAHLICETGKDPIYKEGDATTVLSGDNVKDVTDPLKKILNLFQEGTQYCANLDEAQWLTVKWQKPESWLPPPPVDSSSTWKPAPPPPQEPASSWKPAPPPPASSAKELAEKAKSILETPIDGRAWEIKDQKIDESLSRLYVDINSKQDQKVLEWLLKYYRSVYNLYKDHGATDPKEQTVKHLFTKMPSDCEFITKLHKRI